MRIHVSVMVSGGLLACAVAQAEPLPQLQAYTVPEPWLAAMSPLPLADNVWHIGTEQLTALLVKTADGAILIDGGMPQGADMLLDNMRTLGVAPEDLKWILVSHGHGDHAGSLAAIQRATGARLAANAETAMLMAAGGAHDIHFDDEILYPPVSVDRQLQDGEQVTLGEVTLTSIGSVARATQVKDQDSTDLDGDAMVKELHDDNVAMIKRLKGMKPLAEEAGDNATDGLLDDWTDMAEERAWFLKSTLG